VDYFKENCVFQEANNSEKVEAQDWICFDGFLILGFVNDTASVVKVMDHWMVGCFMNYALEALWKEVSITCPSICIERLKKK